MMENNKAHCKSAYSCGICGKEYEKIADRMRCEMNCVKKMEEEEKKAAEARKNAEKACRKAEVEKAVSDAIDLLKAYTDDYGCADLDIKLSSTDFHWPSKMWHYFF